MTVYADSNFFVRLYLIDELYAVDLAMKAVERGRRLPILWLHELEVANAIELSVFLWKKGGSERVNPEAAAGAQGRFRDDCQNPSSLLAAIEIPIPKLVDQFYELSLRHTATHGFRTYDLLHVSAALELGCDTFWSFDAKCSKLAALEGLAVLPGPGL